MAKKRIDYNLAKLASNNAALTEQFNQSTIGSESTIRKVPISELTVNPYQPRINIDKEQLEELAMSIEKEGLLQPILVTYVDDKYIILAGHRRVEAHKLLNKEYIKAVILDKVAHERLAIIPIIENLQRDDMEPIENAIAFKRLLNEEIIKTQAELAKKISVSKQWVSKMLSILKLPDTVLELIKEDKYKDINVLVELNKIKVEKVHEVYRVIKELSRKEAIEYIKSYNSSKKRPQLKQRIKITQDRITINLINIDKTKQEQLQDLISQLKQLLD